MYHLVQYQSLALHGQRVSCGGFLQGKQIDDLFTPERDERLKLNAQLAERTPEVTGKQPLKRFDRSKVIWHEYWPNPNAHYYGIFLIFSACAYRLRYAYDYTSHFDIDEFWVAARGTKERRLPDFLDTHVEKKAVSASFPQVILSLHFMWSWCHWFL